MIFPFQPEVPIVERLRFLTNIIPTTTDSEQRINLRKGPRQEFDYTYKFDDAERAYVENFLFDQLAKAVDVPVWSDALVLSSAASSGDSSVVTYGSTPADLGWTPAYADFRVGGKAIVFFDNQTYDVVTNITISSATIGFDETLANDYPAGAMIVPIRPAIIASPKASSDRYHKNLSSYSITFQVTDNNIDLADTSAFPTYGGLPLLSDANWVDSTLRETWSQKIFLNDGNTGAFVPYQYFDRSLRQSVKAFKTNTKQRLWEIRQLLHYLKGQQKEFYLPTFGKDVIVTTDILSTDTMLSVKNSGYTTFTQTRSPRQVIQVMLLNGIAYLKGITSSTILDSTTEIMSISSALGTNVAIEDIDRVSIVELVRIDGDDVIITHLNGIGSAQIFLPVKTLFPTGTFDAGSSGSGSGSSGSSGSGSSGPACADYDATVVCPSIAPVHMLIDGTPLGTGNLPITRDDSLPSGFSGGDQPPIAITCPPGGAGFITWQTAPGADTVASGGWNVNLNFNSGFMGAPPTGYVLSITNAASVQVFQGTLHIPGADPGVGTYCGYSGTDGERTDGSGHPIGLAPGSGATQISIVVTKID